MISFQLTVSVMCAFMTLSLAHIALFGPDLKVMTLTPSTDHLTNNVTQNLSLECAVNSKVKRWQTSMTQILRIRILKLDVNDQWKLMAEIGRGEDGVQVYDNFLGLGQVKGDMSTSYLNITWPIVTATTFGKYQCDVLSYDTNLKYMSEESNSVILTDWRMEAEQVFNRFQHAMDREIELIDEKFKLLDKSILFEKEDMENKLNDVHKTLMALNESLGRKVQSVDVEGKINSLYEEVSTLRNNLQSTDEKSNSLISVVNQSLRRNLKSSDEKFSNLYEQMSSFNQSLGNNKQSTDKKFNNLYQQVLTLNQSVQHLNNYRPWPEGTYSLLEPLSGCPRGDGWRKGYHAIHTEWMENQNEVSSPSNLLPYTLTREGDNRFIFLNFCTKITDTPGISWPTGTYCINRRGGSCPRRFHSGYIRMDRQDRGTVSRSGGFTPDYDPSSSLSHYYAHYCCRSDGPATIPIDLPTADPFYLYRFGGTCQSVTDMQVSYEHVMIDTEDEDNADEYSNDYHPDGRVNPVRLRLCYYEPK